MFLSCSTSSPTPSLIRPSARIEAGSTAGLNGTYATFGMCDNEMTIIVWTNIKPVRTSSGKSVEGAEFRGFQRAADGRRLEWHCQTTDGESGPVSIGTDECDLLNGRLFLAVLSTDEVKLKQLKRGVNKLTNEDIVPTLRDWHENDPVISSFFADSDETTAVPRGPSGAL